MRIQSTLLALALPLASTAQPDVGLRLPDRYGQTGAGARPASVVVQYADVHDISVPPGPYTAVRGVFVGVSDYRNMNDLANAANDASAMADTLEFVSDLENPVVLLDGDATTEGLRNALSQVGAVDSRGDLFVFFFAGHGIGLRDTATNETTGHLLLNEAPAMQSILQGERGGLVDMQLLTRLFEDAGIDAKHQLVLLDCCFSGFGARGYRTRGSASVETLLANESIYALTAGTAGQPVLDISYDVEGHGLLTGLLLGALSSPEAKGIRFQELGGRRFIKASDLHSLAEDEVPDLAASALQRVLLQTYEARNAGQPPDIRSWQCPPAPNRDPLVDTTCQVAELYRHLQLPHEGRLRGAGMVMLPVINTLEVPPERPESTPRPQRTPRPKPTVPPQIPSTPSPIPTTPLTTAAWTSTIGQLHGVPGYGAQLLQALELIQSGSPAVEQAGVPEIRATADLLVRPIIQSETWKRIYAAEGYVPVPGQGAAEIAWREEWRTRHQAGWEALPASGGRVSPHYEVTFHLRNLGDHDLHYALVALDQTGVLQWIAPANASCPGYSAGSSPLAPGGAVMRFPELDPVTGAPGVWPIEGTMDQYLFLVLTTAPWGELESALQAAGRASCSLAEKAAALRVPPGLAPLPVRGARAVGKVSHELADSTMKSPGADAVPAGTLVRSEGGLLVLSWRLENVGIEDLRPELVADKN